MSSPNRLGVRFQGDSRENFLTKARLRAGRESINTNERRISLEDRIYRLKVYKGGSFIDTNFLRIVLFLFLIVTPILKEIYLFS